MAFLAGGRGGCSPMYQSTSVGLELQALLCYAFEAFVYECEPVIALGRSCYCALSVDFMDDTEKIRLIMRNLVETLSATDIEHRHIFFLK